MTDTNHKISLSEASRRSGVATATLNRWAQQGVVELEKGNWTEGAAAHARSVSRMRERGHSLKQIKKAVREGRLATAVVEDLLPSSEGDIDTKKAAELTGLEPALIERLWTNIGMPISELENLSKEDVQALKYLAAVLAAGFPLVALLQLVRVYGQSLRQIADAESHLVHLYVHEPLMKEGVSGAEIAEEMQGLVKDVLPFSSPLMDFVHKRYLRYFIEQDIVGHMENDPITEEFGRLKVTIAFADLAGYTRFTEEAGEEEALDLVERFVRSVEESLPEEARLVKTIGDEVMVISSDPVSLTTWAVEFQKTFTKRPRPRIGLHYGATIYRDGDYYGSEVNMAARVTARAQGGEVMVTKSVIDNCEQITDIKFEPIGDVSLKGFKEEVTLYTASV